MKVDRFDRSVFLLNCAVPVTLLAWDALHGKLGANPVNFAIRTTGILSLLFLVLSLTVTPLSRLTGFGWLGQFRRMLGLNAFFHTALHFLLFFGFDRGASIVGTVSEIWMRPYLMVGSVGLLIMVPLAITSTNGMIKRLGPSRWKMLHRLAYVAAAAGALHFYMLVKADITRPAAFAAVLGVLFAYRLGAHYWQLRTDAKKYKSTPPVAAPTRSKSWTGKLQVVQVFDETPEVRTFRLAAANGPRLPFDFLPGQFLSLTLAIDGQKVRRSYTIASAPTQTGYCELTIKREARGLASRHLHDSVRAGDLLDVLAPAGKFTFTGAESNGIVLVAGGVGITPLMSKIRYLTDVNWPGDIYLIFSVKTEPHIIFREELEALQRRHPNLHVTTTLTRDQGSAWVGERGRITPALIARSVPEIAGRRVHICGPTEMTTPTRQMLRELGVADNAIRVESFASPSRTRATPDASAANASIPAATLLADFASEGEATLTFARSGRTVPALPRRTVLEIAEELGVPMNYDCRSGVCGQCKTKLLAGRVVMEAEDALDAIDRANNVILSCQARCIDPVVVDA